MAKNDNNSNNNDINFRLKEREAASHDFLPGRPHFSKKHSTLHSYWLTVLRFCDQRLSDA
jgi:hypothetical protein